MNDFIMNFSDHLLQSELISQKNSSAVLEAFTGITNSFCFGIRCLFDDAESQNQSCRCCSDK